MFQVRSIRWLALGVLLLLSVSATAYFRAKPRHFKQARTWLYKTGHSGWNRLIRGIPWKSLKNEARYTSRFRSNAYSLHRESASRHQALVIRGESDLKALRREGKLVEVQKDRGYRVASMNYGKPLLTPKAKGLLQRLGKSFYEESGGSYFTVTSMTRTVSDQKRLTKVNNNATRNVSTHCHGVSFDISYTRFNGKRGHNAKLQRTLEQVLAELQKEGALYAIYEKNVSCFHVTVR